MWQSLSEMSSLQIDGQILQKALFLCYPFWEGYTQLIQVPPYTSHTNLLQPLFKDIHV